MEGGTDGLSRARHAPRKRGLSVRLTDLLSLFLSLLLLRAQIHLCKCLPLILMRCLSSAAAAAATKVIVLAPTGPAILLTLALSLPRLLPQTAN